MSRRVPQKRRAVRRPVVRETRSIAKDNSVIGVLTFVGVFLFLVLMGLLMFDNSEKDRNNYGEEVSFVDNQNQNGNETNNSQNNKFNNNQNKNNQNKIDNTSEKNTEKNEQPEVVNNEEQNNNTIKNNNDDNQKQNIADNSNEGLNGLKQQQPVNKENNTEEINKKNLSVDEIYRARYDAARRTGSEKELLALGEWCEQEGMMGRAEDIYRYIVKISPDNYKARTRLGYIRLDSNWVMEKDAYKLGYYKYDDKWMSTKELKDKGLFLHEGVWITLKEGKEKGLVLHNEELITKEELADIKEIEEEQKKRDKQQETQSDSYKKEYKEAVLSYRHIKIYSPPKGNWSTGRSGNNNAQIVSANDAAIINNNSGGQGLIDTMIDADSGIVLKVQGFSPEILYTFPDGSTAQGSEIKNLLDVFRGEAFNRYDDIIFQDIRRSRYGGETITQQLGFGKLGGKNYGVLLSLFRYETLTYSINITYPVDKYTKLTEAKIKYLFDNMRKLGDY